MKLTLLGLTLLVALGISGCLEIPTPYPTPSPAPAPTRAATAAPSATPVETEANTAAVIRSSVNVHTTADVKSEVIGYVYAGQTVKVLGCNYGKDGDYCKLEQPFGVTWKKPVGYVFRGCLSGNEDKGCEAK